MEKLPRGITGFWKKGKRRPSTTDESLIKNTVEKIKQKSLFRTLVLNAPKADNNFYVISLFSRNEKHLIGINSSFPLYCGIKSMPDWTTIEFYNLPNSLTVILDLNFTELRSDFLNTKLKEVHLTELDQVEREQIEYWNTDKIGNVIFNSYD
ncbi:hypothetical protein [Aquimarina litoralis]|uniref:hypothetical protein n=1 Tax=Aquimarina litoralis TaxID=584605 RepID=UPI001C59875A|nr:hypothetical protein [Aquimarina litoralis]MBW1296298.1 hypothetical protein [Aquimarina litoralis]